MRKLRLLFAFVVLLSAALQSNAQVVLNFTASPRSGCGQLLTTFTPTITGNANPIVTWDWDFGDVPLHDPNQSPGHLYLYSPTTSCYTVTLRATDAAGVTYVKTLNNYICVYAKPVPQFAAAPGNATLGCAPLTVQLIDQTVTAAGSPIVAWQWSSNGGSPGLVGYGGTSPAPGIPNPIFTWTATGTYAPALTVTDINGCKATIQKNAFITVSPTPVASFASSTPNSCTEPHTVTFTNTTNTGGVNTTYTWLIGANPPFVGNAPPPQTFTAGTYDVTLIASGGSCKDTLIRLAYVNVGGSFNFSFTPTSGCAGTTVVFTAPLGSSDWVWDFCDGAGATGDPNPSHTFPVSNLPQCCYPKLTATLPGGCRSTSTSPTPICISSVPQPPLTADNVNFCSFPIVVNFSTTAPSPNVTCSWNMGSTIPDIRTSCGNQSKTYVASDFVSGVANCKLTWTDEYGCSGETTRAINYKPLVPAFTFTKVEGCVPYNTTLANTTAAPIFGSPNSFKWYLDGALYSSGTAPTPAIYNYPAVTPCTHSFKLVVENTLGCKDSITKTIKGGDKPTASFTFAPGSTCAQFPVIFNVSASTAAPSPCALDPKMLLNFGPDNETATTFTTSPISHLYQDTSTVCRKKPYLIVYSGGCASDTARAGCVYIQPTIAKFEFVKTCTDKTLFEFNAVGNTPISRNSIGADLCAWSITPSTGVTFVTGTQNGPTASSGRITVRFVPGTYTVVLTTTNNTSGCTQSKTKTIIVANPTAAFTMTNTQGCVDLLVQCTSTTNDAANIRSYAWSMNPAPLPPLMPPVFSFAAGANTIATFSTPGAYDGMQLVVTDVNGCTTTAVQNGIEAQGSAASFTTSPVEGCVPSAVLFTDNSVVFPTGATITEHSWDIQNNGTLFPTGAPGYYEYSSATANTASYNITAAGVYQMKHVIKTLVGGVTCKDSIIKAGFTGYAPVAFFASPTVRCANQVLPITNTSAGTGTLTHVWSINGVVDASLGTGPTPIVSFLNDGVYLLCDEVTEATALACKDSMCLTINVGSPIMSFSGTNLSIPCPPLSPSLVCTSQNLTSIRWEIWKDIMTYPPPPAAPIFVRTDYSNGLLATSQGQCDPANPFDFVLTEAGCYTVKLFGTTASGCQDSLVKNAYICISGPSADVTVVPTIGCAPLSATFNITNAVGQVDIVYDTKAPNLVIHNTPSPTDSHTQVYANPGIYAPTILLSDGLGCDIVIPTATITVDSASGWTGYIKDNICIGDCAIIYASSVSPLATYQWLANGTFDPLTATNKQITVCPLVTTTYTVTITDPNGCAKITSITVTVKNQSLPTVTIAPGTPTICAGASIILFATGVQGGTTIPDVSGYNWTLSSTLSDTVAIRNPLATPATNTTYTVTVTGLQGCTRTGTVLVNVIQPVIPMLSDDHTICRNASITLSILSTADVHDPLWSPSVRLSTLSSPSTVASPLTDQVYYVTALDNTTNCPVKDSIKIFVLQPGTVSAGPDKAFCVGTPVTLQGSVPTGLAGVTSTIWTPQATLIRWDTETPEASTTVEQIYTLSYTIDQCIQEDMVTVRPLAAATIAGTGGTICRNATIQLEATGFSNFYTWTPSNTLTADNISNPIASPTETTTYNVVGSLGGNCATASAQITVNVNQLPQLSITPQNTTFFPNPNLKVKLVANTDPNNIIVWDPQIIEPTPLLDYYSAYTTVQFTPPNVGDRYQYLVTVTDANSCTNTSVVTLTKRTECEDSQIFVPTAFSPNGDGKNDVLYARGSAINGITVFRVFDRWGNMMFETTDIKKGWDGTYQGKFVNPDVYVYYLEAPCALDKRPIFQKGNVTVIR